MTVRAPFDWAGVRPSSLDLSRETEVLERLDTACLVNGILQVMPSQFYEGIAQHDLSLWCVRRGLYCLPTLELVNFVRDQIGDRDAVEIGVGNGALGRAVGIRMTDSRQQETPAVKALYGDLDQAVVTYGADVEKLTALEAVEEYTPQVVVGAWVTHRYV